MGKVGILLAWCLVGTACGRVAFDPLDGSDGVDADEGPPVLSCSGLAATCGPAGTSPCCGSPLVPGGSFFRSYDVGTDNAYTDMTNPATVSDFRLDRYEVTVGRFRQFINAGVGTQANPPPAGAGARTLNSMARQGGWDPAWNVSLAADTTSLVAALSCDATYQSWTNAPGANESLPMNCITWFEALAFCAWDSGFMPTEAEWNYASAGGEQRVYPWSSPPSSLAIDCSYANHFDTTGYCVPLGAVNRVGSESPQGDAAWGQADLSGNLWEWTLDYMATYRNPCTDCALLTPGTTRAVRGGGAFVIGAALRGAHRDVAYPEVRAKDLGVRCARSP